MVQRLQKRKTNLASLNSRCECLVQKLIFLAIILIPYTAPSINSVCSVNAKPKPPKETAREHPNPITSHLCQRSHRGSNSQLITRVEGDHLSSSSSSLRPHGPACHDKLFSKTPLQQLDECLSHFPSLSGHSKGSCNIDKRPQSVSPTLWSPNLLMISAFVRKFLSMDYFTSSLHRFE